MKKLIVLMFILSSFAFSANNNDIEQKLNMIIERMNKMQKQLDSKDQEIKKLKQEVKKQKVETKKEFLVNSCDKIKVINFNYIYHENGGIVPYYTLVITLKNTYPYAIKKFAGKLLLKDQSDTTMLTEYIESSKTFLKNGNITIKKNHMINSQLESSMKSESPSNIKAIFSPSAILFSNGKKAQCGGLFNISF